jgi:hypothetical protein
MWAREVANQAEGYLGRAYGALALSESAALSGGFSAAGSLLGSALTTLGLRL